jgi:hypothetical protein
MERSWYYMQDNQQIGPVPQSQLVQLMQNGAIQSDTFIWSEGMADWKPAGQVNFEGDIPQLKPARPTPVTVFGILNVVFGGLGLMCAPFAIFAVLMPQPAQTATPYPPGMQVFTLFLLGLRIPMAAVLLAAGVGLLKQKNWGRRVAYFFGWFAIALGVVSLAVTMIVYGASLGDSGDQGSAQAVGGLVGGMCGGIIGFIYPILLVVYMRKPNVVEACKL